MKKILFATTALVMTAGVASAEVALSGDGRMGIVYDGEDAQFSSRARVQFTLSGETDGGLAFGGKFRVNDEGGSRVRATSTSTVAVDDDGNIIIDASGNPVYTTSTSNNGRYASEGVRGTVYMSGAFGKLEMGNVVSASEAAIGDLTELGYTAGEFAGDIEEFAYLTGDGENVDQGPNVLYSYTVGSFGFYASFSDGDSSAFGTGSLYEASFDDDEGDDVAYSLAVGYSFGDYEASIGYSDDGDASEIAVGGTAAFGDLKLKAVYLDFDDRFVDSDEYKKSYGISADYTFGATTLSALYKRDEFESEDYDSYGVGAFYDLGGGATLAAGVIDTDFLDDTVADFGVSFKF